MDDSDRDYLVDARREPSAASAEELTAYFRRQQSAGDAAVEHVETHLSHVFLCRDVVYKLLKPVKFAFVDFSTVDRRREECRAEVELNRPLAGDVYLAAEPVRRLSAGGIRIGGDGGDAGGSGTIVDWAIKMRRLPAECTLEALHARGEATVDHIESLAAALVRYYRSATKATLTGHEYVAAVEHHVRDNLAELARGEHGLPHGLIERVHAAQLTTLALLRTWFADRAKEGFVVEGHGDLRPEHVYFLPQPIIIDCLAFSRELRTLDIADEIAFLAMELRRLGSQPLADALIAAYQQGAADRPPAELWAFYQAYRACVRAKVAVLRAAQRDEPGRSTERAAARAYLDLADSVAKALERPMCIVVRGLSGTGKSTLAAALAEKLGVAYLQTDHIRKQLFPGAAPASYGQGCYTTAARRIVYDAMRAQACERLASKQSVILDGTFLTAASRSALAEVAAKRNAPLVVLRCHCGVEIAAQRIANRAAEGRSESDAHVETLKRQSMEEEADPAGIDTVCIDTTEPLERQLQVAYDLLRAAFIAARGK